MSGKKPNRTQPGIPAKVILALAFIILVVLLLTVGRKFISYEVEYRNDQKRIASVFGNRLAPTIKEEVKYPIKSFAIPRSPCWLAAGAGVAKYLEPDIDVATFVFYGTPTLYMAGRNKNERYGYGLSWLRAFKNLGYTVYYASTNPEHPPQNVYPDIAPENMIYFKSYEEEVSFIKKLLSNGFIPVIGAHRRGLGFDDDGGDFVVVAGYNQEGFWLVSPDPKEIPVEVPLTDPPKITEPWFFSNKQFKQVFKGNRQLFWLEKTGTRKSLETIYEENKRNAQEAAENMERTKEYLLTGGNPIHVTDITEIPTAVGLYNYFKGKNEALSQHYLKIAETQRNLLKDFNYSEAELLKHPDKLSSVFDQIIPLAQETAKMW